jgi:hypothetical protein
LKKCPEKTREAVKPEVFNLIFSQPLLKGKEEKWS